MVKVVVTKRDYWLGGGFVMTLLLLLVFSARSSEAETTEMPIEDKVEVKAEPIRQRPAVGSNATPDAASIVAESISRIIPMMIAVVILGSIASGFIRVFVDIQKESKSRRRK